MVTLNTEEENRIQGLRYMKRKQEREFDLCNLMIVLAELQAENIYDTFAVVSYMAVVHRRLYRCCRRNSATFDISAVIAHESVNLIVTIHNHLSTANRAFHN